MDKMEVIDSDIPTPDTSGAANTQQAANVPALIKQPDSPMGMGQVVVGLAADSYHGLNRQSTHIVGTFLTDTMTKLEAAEKEISRLSPLNAVYEERIANLSSQQKISAFLGVLASVLIGFGSSYLTSSPATNTSGWVLLLCGLAIYGFIIFSSCKGKK